MKTALIFGVTGQDGAYLTELLLSKGYFVHGVKRRTSLLNTDRIDHLYDNPNLKLHYGDVTDSLNVVRLVQETLPDEIYNLAAMSHVKVSFETPEYTAQADGLGSLRILEAIIILGLKDKTKYYQASTSELYGMVQQIPQTESTPFYPRSPYACAKLYAYWITVNYRESYGIYACNGILFNHESPLRGETFVTRKITRAIGAMMIGSNQPLLLGNLNAERDWGHAKDYVEAMWLMLQQEQPEDFVISTGKKTSVREFVKMAFRVIGVEIEFLNKGSDEIGIVCKSENTELFPIGRRAVVVDKKYYRPSEVDLLIGNSSNARTTLGWNPSFSIEDIVSEMVKADIELFKERGIYEHFE